MRLLPVFVLAALLAGCAVRHPVYEAVRDGDADRTMELVALTGPDERITDRRVTALWLASYFRQPQVAAALLDAGADPDARTPAFAITPLATTVTFREGDDEKALLDVVRLLIGRGADVNAFDVSGRTALARAAATNRHVSRQTALKALEALLEAGADPNYEIDVPSRRAEGGTVWLSPAFYLAYVPACADAELLKALLAHGADPGRIAVRKDALGRETEVFALGGARLHYPKDPQGEAVRELVESLDLP